jgi:hypothetical protein
MRKSSLDSIPARSSMLSEDGYALPSVLMLVTILSLVAFSVLSLEYLERRSAMLDVARVKAEYAAQNGIVCMAADLGAGPLSDSAREFNFYDGSRASVRVVPSGALYLVESTGYSGKTKSLRRATLGQQPGEAFSLALALGNTSHQLILTGDASIIGDVASGPAGVSTGQLHGYSTPAVVPIRGMVTNLAAQAFPQASLERIKFIGDYYRNLLQMTNHGAALGEIGVRRLGAIPDSLGNIVLQAGSVLEDSITRQNVPLYLTSRGNITIGQSARLLGLISVISSDSIIVKSGASISGCVLVAMKGIRVGGAVMTSIHLISPHIALNSGSVGRYPSLALSIPLDPTAPVNQKLLLAQGTSFEGFIGMVSPRGDDVLELASGSRLKGAVFSSGRLTLDGDLIGSAVTSDLYFYEAPTSYFGWKRAGTVDRVRLPMGLLIAPIFSGKHVLSVFEWL